MTGWVLYFMAEETKNTHDSYLNRELKPNPKTPSSTYQIESKL